MPKAVIEFNLPEEQEEFDDAVKAGKMASALYNIRQEIFRPARKHGFSDVRIQRLLNENGKMYYLIELLEDKFNEILQKYDVLDKA